MNTPDQPETVVQCPPIIKKQPSNELREEYNNSPSLLHGLSSKTVPDKLEYIPRPKRRITF